MPLHPSRIAAAIIIFATICFWGCAGPQLVPYRTQFTGDQLVETLPLPQDPASVDLTKYPGDESNVKAIEQGAPAPFAGIIVDERRAARDWLYRTSYEDLRTEYVTSNKLISAQRAVYEAQLTQASKTINSLQPNWWDQHKFEIGLISGFFLATLGGIAIAIH